MIQLKCSQNALSMQLEYKHTVVIIHLTCTTQKVNLTCNSNTVIMQLECNQHSSLIVSLSHPKWSWIGWTCSTHNRQLQLGCRWNTYKMELQCNYNTFTMQLECLQTWRRQSHIHRNTGAFRQHTNIATKHIALLTTTQYSNSECFAKGPWIGALGASEFVSSLGSGVLGA